jgi:O-antigen/teichoic acid export membrane protein
VSQTSERLLNVGIRFLTLGLRFLFIFFLAKYLDISSVGYYGLFTASVGYCLYFVGMDFYVYAAREILEAPRDRRGLMLKGQMGLSLLLYLGLTPVALLFLSRVSWPADLIWWFLPILLLEHFNQEVSRLLVALSEQVFASIVLFVRQGSWAIAAVLLMSWSDDSRNLGTIVALWACAGIFAAILGAWKVWRLRMGGWRDAIDWRWVKKGVALSAAFLVATLALRGIQTVDRYWLEALAGVEIVGAYVLFLGATGALMVFLDASVFSFGYPALITHNYRKEYGLARARVQMMLYQTLAICLAFALASWIALPILLDWIGNPAYGDAVFLYPWLLAAMIVNAISMVPHYGLYGARCDRPIIYSHLAALPTFGLFVIILGRFWPIAAVPAALVAAFALILIWKTFAYLWVSRGPDRGEMHFGTPSN